MATRHKQLELDFPRGEQLAILRDADLPGSVPTKRGGVSKALLKAVLRTIDDHGRVCFAKQETLAREIGCSTDQVKRAVDALQTLSLICVERARTPSGTVCNHYRIVWNELALLAPSKARRQSVMVPEQSVMVPEQSVMVPEQSVMVHTCIGSVQETQHEPTTTPTACAVATWAEVEAELIREGVTDFPAAIRAARSRVEPFYVLEVIAHYRAARGFKPGALKRRVERSHPKLQPGDGWPPPAACPSQSRQADPADKRRAALLNMLRECRRGRSCQEGDALYLAKAKAAGISEAEARKLIE